MVRYYRRRRRGFIRRRASKRYSVETTVAATSTTLDPSEQLDGPNDRVIVVPVTDLQGMRKVKNFTVEGCPATVAEGTLIAWALVYVPNVRRAGPIDTLAPFPDAPTSLYEPNQHVIMQGVWNSMDPAPVKRFSRLSRNLNSEDAICLIVRQYSVDGLDGTDEIPEHYSVPQKMIWTVKYAIAY